MSTVYRLPVVHKKTGKIYFVQHNVINATNDCDGQKMVLYVNEEGMPFVRESKEFWDKFSALANYKTYTMRYDEAKQGTIVDECNKF